MMGNAQARAVTVCFGLVGLFSVYSFRLIDLQIVQHEKFTTLAAEKHNHKQIIYARRGIIREPITSLLPKTSRSRPLLQTHRILGIRGLWQRQSRISLKWIRATSRIS